MAVELALAIDPYPRKVGGNLGEVGHNLTGINLTNEEEYWANKAPNMKNPFALLDKLKNTRSRNLIDFCYWLALSGYFG